METVRRILFEQPVYLYVPLALAEAVLLFRWHQRRTRRSALWLAVPAVLAGLVLLLDCLVVTDREQIIAASKEIARDAQAGSVAAAEKYLDENFAGFYQSRKTALYEARQALAEHRPRLVALSDVDLAVAGRQGEMSLTMIVVPGAGPLAGRRFPLAWKIHWVKVTVGGRLVWRISSAAPIGRLGG